MENQDTNKLQLFRHEEVFPSREEAVNYIEDVLQPDVLIGEPAVVFYGTDRDRNAILALGSGNRKVFLIDVAELKEQIAVINDTVTDGNENLEQLKQSVSELVLACGLDYDDNKKSNQITYVPNSRDEIIGSCKSLAESVNALSEFIQKNVSENSIEFVDSKTVELVYTDAPKGGKNLTANVKVSEEGKDDDLLYNDNIIGVKKDGIFASVNVRYDEDTNRIIFTSSGLKDGKFMTDAKRQVIQLPNAGVIVAKNSDESPVKVQVKKNDEGKTKISAEIKVSDSKNNILKVQDGALLVDGRANNIAYKDTTVAKKLDELQKDSEQIAQDLLDEIKERTNQANNIVDKLEQEIKDRKHADEDIKHLIDDLDISGLKETVDAFKQTYNEFEKEWAAYKVQIEKAINDAETVVGKVNDIEKKLVENETNLNNLIERVNKAEDNINNNTAKIADNTLAITNEATLARQNESDLRTALEKEVTRSVAKDEELEGLVKGSQSDVESLKNRANSLENSVTSLQETDTRLEGLINANKSAIDENKNSIGTISTSVAGLRNELENEVTRATSEEKRIEEKLDNLVTSSKAASDNALDQAKNYTDSEILKLKSDASDDATSKANKALEDAKAYSDEKLALETARAQAAEEKNSSDITELKAKDAEIEANVAKKVESVKVEKVDDEELKYQLLVDGQIAGYINIPKDQFLKDVRYDVGTKSLVFTWAIDDDSQKVTNVDVSEFLSTYYAGNGLKMVENTFSVKLTTANESYLQVTEDGIQLVGIDAKFDTKADKADVYTKLEVDNAVEAEAIRAKGIESGLQTAIDSANESAKELASRVTETENKLGILQGNFAQEGSVENAIYQSKTYTDEKISEVNTEIAKKANIEDVYTKNDIDNKGYLVNSDIEDLAKKSEVEAESERAKDAESKNESAIASVKEVADNNALEIAQIKKDVASLEPFVEETNTVKMHANKSANGTTYSSDVKLDLEKANILKVSGNGLYAEVNLTYNTAENKLTFIAGGVEREFQLAGASTLQDAYYNSANRQLVFVVSLQNGETKQVTVDVNDLINTLRVENLPNSPVQLTLTQDAQGNDLLSANLIISTKDDNAVLSDNGTLYVSKRAANMTALWGDDADKNLQVVLNEIKTRTDSIDEIKSDVGQLKSDVSDLTKQVNENTLSITNINNTLNEYNTRLEKVEGSVTEIQTSLSTLQEAVDNIQKEIGGGEEGGSSIKERLEALEEICNNLIDFGTYER